MKDDQEIGRSSLSAQLRLDPCIALSVGQSTTLWDTVTVYGDVNCIGNLTNHGKIYGDVFADDLIGIPMYPNQEKSRQVLQNLSFSQPNLTVADFLSRYSYGSLSGQTFGPYDPSKVCYSWSSLTLTGDISINGMLLVDGDLTISGVNNVIVAGKNLPALYVTGDLIIEKDANLQITGLAVVGNRVLINDNANNLNITGGLFIQNMLSDETTADSSGNSYPGKLYNGPTRQPGHTGRALQFDGDNDYVQTSNNSTKLQIVNDYTLSVWIKPNATQKSWAGIVSKTDSLGTVNHWTLQFDSSSPKKLVIYHPDFFSDPKWETGITLSDVAGAWHHITVVRNGSSMTSYLDPADGSYRRQKTWSTLPGNGYGHLNIGVDRTASSSYVYKGLIDDVRVYNKALDSNSVKRIYTGLPDPNNIPIGHWKMDESGSNVTIVTITAAPEKSAVLLGSDGKQRWGQAAGAFFRSIRRN